MPCVSVIIPTYNRSAVVPDAIGSALAQTIGDIEVIIVDDGSTDDTAEVVKAVGDDRIRYCHQSNTGPAGARNLGISKAQGQFIAFLDSDDSWPGNYLETMVSRLNSQNEYDAAYCPITMVYADGRMTKSYKCPAGKQGWIGRDLFAYGFIWPSAVVLRRSKLGGFFFDEGLKNSSEDSDAFLRLALKIKFAFVSEVESLHKHSSDSISQSMGVNFNRVLSLERFYFQIGGDKVVNRMAAYKRFSKAYRRLAENSRRKGFRNRAFVLYKKAIFYWPVDIRLYLGFLKVLLLKKSQDSQPIWKMPKPLDRPKGTNSFSEEQRCN